MRTLITTLLLVLFASSYSGCKKGLRTANEAIEAFNNAIEEFSSISDTWDGNFDELQEIIVSLQDELDGDFTRYIDRLETIANDAERVSLNLSTCVTQYLVSSIIYEIELLRNELTGAVSPSLVGQVPPTGLTILCHSFNHEISLSAGVEEFRWTIHGYLGELGSEIDLKLFVVQPNGDKAPYANTIVRNDNNQLHIDITNLFYADVLNGAFSVQIVDCTSNNRVLGEYRIYP